jgi:hypothetical protein
MYLESEINEKLESLREKFVDKSIDFKNVKSWLEECLKKYKVKMNVEDDSEIPKDKFRINAFYGEDPEGHEIEVCIVKNPEVFSITTDSEGFDTFLFYISQAVQHEIIHRHQFFMREYDTIELPQKYRSKEKNLKIRQAQEYLGHTDEIDARANDLFLEIKRAGKNISCLAFLQDIVKECDTLSGYIAVFEDSDNKVVKRLLTRTWKYAKAAETV